MLNITAHIHCIWSQISTAFNNTLHKLENTRSGRVAVENGNALQGILLQAHIERVTAMSADDIIYNFAINGSRN